MIHPLLSELWDLTSSWDNCFAILVNWDRLLKGWLKGWMSDTVIIGEMVPTYSPAITHRPAPRHPRSVDRLLPDKVAIRPTHQRVNKQTRQQRQPSPRFAMPGVVLTNPAKTIQTMFHESQRTAATHRKLVNSLRTLQLTCLNKGQEEGFNDEFIRCVNRVLPVKKSEPTADRVVKFVGTFIQHVQDKSMSQQSPPCVLPALFGVLGLTRGSCEGWGGGR